MSNQAPTKVNSKDQPDKKTIVHSNFTKKINEMAQQGSETENKNIINEEDKKSNEPAKIEKEPVRLQTTTELLTHLSKGCNPPPITGPGYDSPIPYFVKGWEDQEREWKEWINEGQFSDVEYYDYFSDSSRSKDSYDYNEDYDDEYDDEYYSDGYGDGWKTLIN